jgi:hypothetical protein
LFKKVVSGKGMEDNVGRNVVFVCMIRNAYKILVGNLKGRDVLEYLGVNGRVILKWERILCEGLD